MYVGIEGECVREQITGRVGESIGCVQCWHSATPRSTQRRAACPRFVVAIHMGRSRATCRRRNISPVKSLARPLRRTARLACASRCAPTETRAPLVQSSVFLLYPHDCRPSPVARCSHSPRSLPTINTLLAVFILRARSTI
ncbi:unnamed protein product [Euphydryas editha]|uniref:Uncharacterized protein n=1 Tax=Euphydryas editha TaxID=104508 RepID=A0AAU9UF89_EUPED|nr:unnamed protein product [Euphydryas editha]